MYNFDVNRIVKLLLPPILRVGKNIDFLLIPFRIIDNIINELKQLRNKQIYFSQFNSQTIVLQHLLNDLFDNQLRRIYIINTANIYYPYFYNEIENKPPIYLHYKIENMPFYMKFQIEYHSLNDFIVYVPSALTINIQLMKYYIDYYKVAGKKYIIQTY